MSTSSSFVEQHVLLPEEGRRLTIPSSSICVSLWRATRGRIFFLLSSTVVADFTVWRLTGVGGSVADWNWPLFFYFKSHTLIVELDVDDLSQSGTSPLISNRVSVFYKHYFDLNNIKPQFVDGPLPAIVRRHDLAHWQVVQKTARRLV